MYDGSKHKLPDYNNLVLDKQSLVCVWNPVFLSLGPGITGDAAEIL